VFRLQVHFCSCLVVIPHAPNYIGLIYIIFTGGADQERTGAGEKALLYEVVDKIFDYVFIMRTRVRPSSQARAQETESQARTESEARAERRETPSPRLRRASASAQPLTQYGEGER
jgi:hypothetical protein